MIRRVLLALALAAGSAAQAQTALQGGAAGNGRPAGGAAVHRPADIDLSDFASASPSGALDPTGAIDMTPVFMAAINSVGPGSNIKLVVPNIGGSARYRLNSNITSNGRFVAVDLTSGALAGSNFGGAGPGVLYVQRIDQTTPDHYNTQIQAQGRGAGVDTVYNTNIVNNGGKALVGYYQEYQNYNTGASNINGGDIAEWHLSQWMVPTSTSSLAMFGNWTTTLSPLTSTTDVVSGGVKWNLLSIEYNPVNNGPDPSWSEYDPDNRVDGATGAAAGVPLTGSHGIIIQPDIWAPTGGLGGSGQFAFGCLPSPELNKRQTKSSVAHQPTSSHGAYQNGWESCLHIGNNAVWQGGHGLYLGGRTGKRPDGAADPTVTGAAIYAKYAWGPALIDATEATFGTGAILLGTGPTQGIYWGGRVSVHGDSSGNLNLDAPGGARTGNGVIAVGSVPAASGSCSIKDQIGGNWAGSFRAGGACSAGTIVLTFATTAPNGWACVASDLTAPAGALRQSAYSARTATFSATMAANDLATFSCTGF